MSSDKTQVNITETGIIYDFENDLYGQPSNSNINQWISTKNGYLNDLEHFIVWMRPEITSNFRKIWGIIPTSLKKGNYNLTIQNSFFLLKRLLH